jgi:membrane protein implicated in regulation of membrane protease activity
LTLTLTESLEAVADLLLVMALFLLAARMLFGFVARFAAWIDSGFRWSPGPVTTGTEAMIRRRGVARTGLDPQGKVRVGGELWNAVASEPVAEGREVEVLAVEGLTLRVTERHEAPKGPPGAASNPSFEHESSEHESTEHEVSERRISEHKISEHVATKAGRESGSRQGGSSECHQLH